MAGHALLLSANQPRQVKKPEPGFPATFTIPYLPPSVCLLSHECRILSVDMGENSRGGEGYELDKVARIHDWDGGSRTAATQRVLGDGKLHPAQPDQGTCVTQRRGAQDTGRARQAVGQ